MFVYLPNNLPNLIQTQIWLLRYQPRQAYKMNTPQSRSSQWSMLSFIISWLHVRFLLVSSGVYISCILTVVQGKYMFSRKPSFFDLQIQTMTKAQRQRIQTILSVLAVHQPFYISICISTFGLCISFNIESALKRRFADNILTTVH